MAQGATDASAQLNAQLGVQREQAAGPLRSAAQAEAAPAPEAGTAGARARPRADRSRAGCRWRRIPSSRRRSRPSAWTTPRIASSTDQAMADAGVSTEQLQRGNEPEFAPALEARSTAEAHEASAGPQYRETEAAMRGESRAQAEARLGGGLTGMRAQRLDLIGQVVGEQESTKTHQSQQRRLVTERVAAIKEATRHDVEVILTAMDANAVAIFDVGLREAEGAYEDAFEEAKGGIGNWLTEWGSDWDELIEESLATGRAAYLERVGRAIDEVATLVESQLAAAKQRVAPGRAEVDAYVAGLDEGLRAAGEEARQQVSGDFDALESSVDERRDRLVERLTQQYRDSYQRMSETENRLREENKSLWQRVYDATVGVIKKIIEFKNLLLRGPGPGRVGDHADHRGSRSGSSRTSSQAVTQGVTNFKDHIVEHLKKGLLDWVFGAVARAGIELPATFDLKGILSLVLQILGLTWQNIRRIAVEMVGEPIVHALEMFAEPIIVLVREGPSGLWEWIKEKLTDLKSMLLDEIQGWLITNVIEAGITWIISLLNPASAFLKACKAIYDIVKFFVERARQIADFVKAVTESIGAIARGSLGAAAQRVEDALARAIPVAIGFLASLLGLDDLSGTIERFIQRIREPIEQAIRWLIGKAVDLVKAAGKLLGIGKDEGSEGRGGARCTGRRAASPRCSEAVAQRTGGEAARSDAESIASARAERTPRPQADRCGRCRGLVALPRRRLRREEQRRASEVRGRRPGRQGRRGVGRGARRGRPADSSKEPAAFEAQGKDVALRAPGRALPRPRGGDRAPRSPVTPVAAARPWRSSGSTPRWRCARAATIHGKRTPDYRTVVPVGEGETGRRGAAHLRSRPWTRSRTSRLPPRSRNRKIPETKAQQLFAHAQERRRRGEGASAGGWARRSSSSTTRSSPPRADAEDDRGHRANAEEPQRRPSTGGQDHVGSSTVRPRTEAADGGPGAASVTRTVPWRGSVTSRRR